MDNSVALQDGPKVQEDPCEQCSIFLSCEWKGRPEVRGKVMGVGECDHLAAEGHGETPE